MTVVADREGDIYDMWPRLPDKHTGLLVRARHDRSIERQGARASLFDWLSAQPELDRYEVDLPALNERRSAHKAVMQVRFAPVSIRRPHSCTDKKAPASVSLWAMEVREDRASVVGSEKPIHWRLLTSHRVQTAQMARQCIGWYCQRWHIEQLFRTLKRQGLDVESSLLETGARLQKLAVLALSAATRTLQLTLARDGSQRPASDAFTNEEIEVLKQIAPTLEGKTAKQKNPHPPQGLSWAAWIIGRLGGWNGYASERKSGPITMHRGLKEFTAIWRGWCFRQGLCDMCTQ